MHQNFLGFYAETFSIFFGKSTNQLITLLTNSFYSFVWISCMVAFDILSEAIRSFMCVSLNGFVLIMIMFQPLRPSREKHFLVTVSQLYIEKFHFRNTLLSKYCYVTIYLYYLFRSFAHTFNLYSATLFTPRR